MAKKVNSYKPSELEIAQSKAKKKLQEENSISRGRLLGQGTTTVVNDWEKTPYKRVAREQGWDKYSVMSDELQHNSAMAYMDNMSISQQLSDMVVGGTKKAGGMGLQWVSTLDVASLTALSLDSTQVNYDNWLYKVGKGLVDDSNEHQHFYDSKGIIGEGSIFDFNYLTHSVQQAMGSVGIAAAQTVETALLALATKGAALTPAGLAAKGVVDGMRTAYMNAMELHDQTYQDMIDKGFTEEQAKEGARQNANLNYKNEMMFQVGINVVQNMLFKGFLGSSGAKIKTNFAKNAGSKLYLGTSTFFEEAGERIAGNFVKSKLGKKAVGVGANILGESIEEGVEQLAQIKTKYDLEGKELTWDRIKENSDELLEAAFQGGFGGIFMSTVQSAGGTLWNWKRNKQLKALENDIPKIVGESYKALAETGKALSELESKGANPYSIEYQRARVNYEKAKKGIALSSISSALQLDYINGEGTTLFDAEIARLQSIEEAIKQNDTELLQTYGILDENGQEVYRGVKQDILDNFPYLKEQAKNYKNDIDETLNKTDNFNLAHQMANIKGSIRFIESEQSEVSNIIENLKKGEDFQRLSSKGKERFLLEQELIAIENQNNPEPHLEKRKQEIEDKLNDLEDYSAQDLLYQKLLSRDINSESFVNSFSLLYKLDEAKKEDIDKLSKYNDKNYRGALEAGMSEEAIEEAKKNNNLEEKIKEHKVKEAKTEKEVDNIVQGDKNLETQAQTKKAEIRKEEIKQSYPQENSTENSQENDQVDVTFEGEELDIDEDQDQGNDDDEINNILDFSPKALNPEAKIEVNPALKDLIDLYNKKYSKTLKFENFISILLDRMGGKDVDEHFEYYAYQYELITGDKVDNKNNVYNNVVFPRYLNDHRNSKEIYTDEEIFYENKTNQDTIVTQSNPVIVNNETGETKVVVDVKTIDTVSIYPHTPGFLGVQYKESLDEETGQIIREDASEQLNDPEKNKNVLNPEVAKVGAKFNVRPISEEEFENHFVYDYKEDGSKEFISFKEWLQRHPEVKKDSIEYINKIPIVAETAEGDFVFEIKANDWYRPENVIKEDVNSTKAAIDGHKLANQSERQSIYNGEVKQIEITKRKFGHFHNTLDGRKLPISETTPGKKVFAIAKGSNELLVDGKTSFKGKLINIEPLKVGQGYQIKEVNTGEYIAIAITPNQLSNGEQLPKVAIKNMEMATKAAITYHANTTISRLEGKTDITESEQKRLNSAKEVLEYMAKTHDMSIEKANIIRAAIAKTGIDITKDLDKYLGSFVHVNNNINDVVNKLSPDNPNTSIGNTFIYSHNNKTSGTQQFIVVSKTDKGVAVDPKTNRPKLSGMTLTSPTVRGVEILLGNFSGDTPAIGNMQLNLNKDSINKDTPMIEIQEDGSIIEQEGTYNDFIAENTFSNNLSHEIPTANGETKTITDVHPIIEFKTVRGNSNGDTTSVSTQIKNTTPVEEQQKVEEVQEKENVSEDSVEEISNYQSTSIAEDLNNIKKDPKGAELFKGYKNYKLDDNSFSPVNLTPEEQEIINELFSTLIPGLNLNQQQAIVKSLSGLIFNTYMNKHNLGKKIDKAELARQIKQVSLREITRLLNTENARAEYLNENGMSESKIAESVKNKIELLETVKNNLDIITDKEGDVTKSIEKIVKDKVEGDKQDTLEDNTNTPDDGESFDEVNNIDESDNAWNKEAYQHDVKSSFSNKLKFYFAGVKKIHPITGEVMTNFMEMDEYYPVEDIFNMLVSQLANVPSDWDMFMDQLNARSHNPIVKAIKEKMDNIPDQLKNEVLYKVGIHRLQMMTVKYDSRELSVVNENFYGGKMLYISEWMNNLLTSEEHKFFTLDKEGNYKFDSEEVRKYGLAFQKWAKSWEKKNTEEKGLSEESKLKFAEELQKAFYRMGIDLPMNTVRHLVETDGVDIVTNRGGKLAGIVSQFTNYQAVDGNFDIRGFRNTITDYLESLADAEMFINGERVKGSFRIKDKTVQETLLPTLAKMLNFKLTDSNSDYFQNLLKTVYAKDASILEALQESEELQRFFAVDFLSIDALSVKGQDAKKIVELSYEEKMAVQQGLFTNTVRKTSYTKNGIKFRIARALNMTISDKTNMPLHTTLMMDLQYSDLPGESDFDITGSEVNLNDRVLNFMFDEVFVPEFNRVIKAYGENTNIKNYDGAARMFLSLAEFNMLKDSEGKNILDTINALSENGPISEDIKGEILARFKESAKEVLNSYFISEAKEFESILDTARNPIKYDSSKGLTSFESKTRKALLGKVLALDMAVNNLYNNINQSKLYSGDLPLYAPAVAKYLPKDVKNKLKGAKTIHEKQTIINSYLLENPQKIKDIVLATGESQLKRLAMQIAPGNLLANSKGDNYIQIFVNDVETPSTSIPFFIEMMYGRVSTEAKEHSNKITEAFNTIEEAYNNLELTDAERTKIISEQEEIISNSKDALATSYPRLKPFLDITGTDAQEYMTWKEHLDILLRQGKLNEEDASKVRSAYRKLERGEDLSDDELTIIMQPIKPVYAGPTNTRQGGSYNEVEGVNRIVYVKSSSFPLIPQLTKGTKLDNVRKNMEALQSKEGKNVRLSYQSANKVGSIDTKLRMDDLYYGDFDNLWEGKGVLSQSVLLMDRENFKIQQEVPYKTSKFLDKGKEDLIRASSQIWKIIMSGGMNTMGNVFPTQVFDEKLIEEVNTYITENNIGVPLITGDKLSGPQLDVIKHFLDKDYFDSKMLELWEDLGFDSEDPSRIIINIVKILKEEVDSRDYPKFFKEALALTKDLNDNTKISTPLWINNNFEKLDNILQSIVTNRLMVRKTPGNGLISTSSEGFVKTTLNELDKNIANRILWLDGRTSKELQATRYGNNGELLEAEVLVQPKFRKRVYNEETGEYTSEIIDLREKNQAGNYKYLKYNSDEELVINTDMIDEDLLKHFSLRIPVSSHQSGAILKIVGFLPSESADMIVLPKEHTTLLGEDYDIDKRYIYNNNYVVDENGKIETLKDSNKHIKLNQGYTQDEVKEQLRENGMTNVYRSVYMSPDKGVQRKINKILSMEVAENTRDIIKSIADEKAKLKEDPNKVTSIYSVKYQQDQMESGVSGKIGVAMHSLAVTFQGQLERIGGAVIGKEVNIGGVVSDGTIGNIKALKHPSDNSTPRDVADVHAENQNSAVDNIKAQIMFYRNENKYTIGALMQMTFRGFDQIPYNGDLLHLPSLLLAQPIIKQYSDLRSKSDSKLNDYRTFDTDEIFEELVHSVVGEKEIRILRNMVDDKGRRLDLSQAIHKRYGGTELLTSEALVAGLKAENPSKTSQLITLALFRDMDKENNNLSAVKGLASKISLPKSTIEVSALVEDFRKVLKSLSNSYERSPDSINTHSSRVILDLNSAQIQNFLSKTKGQRDEIIKSKNVLKYFVPSSPEGISVKNAIVTAQKLSGEAFGSIHENINGIYQDYLDKLGLNEDDISKGKVVKIKTDLIRAYRDFILASPRTGLFNGTVEEERNRLFYNTESNKALANYLKELKDNPLYKPLFDNIEFLQGFRFDKVTGVGSKIPSLLSYQSSKNFADQELIYDSFSKLLRNDSTVLPDFNGQRMTPRILAQELATYSMLSTGDINIGFRQFINQQYLTSIGFGRHLELNEKVDKDLFLDQFFRHNSKHIDELNPIMRANVLDLTAEELKSDENLINKTELKFLPNENITLQYFKLSNGIIFRNKGINEEGVQVFERVEPLGTFGYNEYEFSKKTLIEELESKRESIKEQIQALKEKGKGSTRIEHLLTNLTFLERKIQIQKGEPIIEENQVEEEKSFIENYLEGKTIKDVLRDISETNPEYSEVVERLLGQNFDDIKILYAEHKDMINPDTGRSSGGVYEHNSRTITLNKAFSQGKVDDGTFANVFLEEVIHAATIGELEKWTDGSKTNNPIPKPNAPRHIHMLVDLFKVAQELPDIKNTTNSYYTKDLREFVAGVFNDVEFAKALDNHKDSQGKSLFDKFKDAIASMIRFISGKTFSEEVRNNVYILLDNKLKEQPLVNNTPNINTNPTQNPDEGLRRIQSSYKRDATLSDKVNDNLEEAVHDYEDNIHEFESIYDPMPKHNFADWFNLVSNESKELTEEELDNYARGTAKNIFSNGRVIAVNNKDSRSEYEALTLKYLLDMIKDNGYKAHLSTHQVIKDNGRVVRFLAFEKLDSSSIETKKVVSLQDIIKDFNGSPQEILEQLVKQNIIQEKC